MKKTQSKSLLIAIAAFAVTTTGVYAYGGDSILERANLSDEQKVALTQAKELQESGDLAAARDALVEAGIDDTVLRKLHKAKHLVHEEMEQALEAGDYAAFLLVVKGTPLAESITTEADFEQFREAHALKSEGDFAAAREILDQLGVKPKQGHHDFQHHQGMGRMMMELSDEQKEALQVARQANDHATVQAIFDEAGVDFPGRR